MEKYVKPKILTSIKLTLAENLGAPETIISSGDIDEIFAGDYGADESW